MKTHCVYGDMFCLHLFQYSQQSALSIDLLSMLLLTCKKSHVHCTLNALRSICSLLLLWIYDLYTLLFCIMLGRVRDTLCALLHFAIGASRQWKVLPLTAPLTPIRLRPNRLDACINQHNTRGLFAPVRAAHWKFKSKDM